MDVDVIVIGAGIAGASVAAELALHRSVLILEAEDSPGYHTSGRSAATFIENYGAPAVRACRGLAVLFSKVRRKTTGSSR